MNRCLFPVLAAILLLTNLKAPAQVMTEYGPVQTKVVDGDTITTVYLKPAFVFKRAADERRWSRLIYNLKVVYPIALEANATLHAMEQTAVHAFDF